MTDTQLTAARTVHAPASVVFALLADPRRHPELDGSDMVRGDVGAEPVTGVGQVFRMDVHHRVAGDYRTDNHVTAFEQDALIAWRTAAVDQEPAGWEWRWRTEARDDGATDVSITYDWSDVHDPAVLARVPLPGVPQEALQRSLENLAAAVEDWLVVSTPRRLARRARPR